MFNFCIINLMVCNIVCIVLLNMVVGSDEVVKFFCEVVFERVSDLLF